MSQTDDLRAVFRDPSPVPSSRRARRAERARKRALSPLRILISLAMVPVVATGLTVSIYVRTSPYEPPDALRHLLAMGGCDVAMKLGVAPAREGGLGYHARNDLDGDGVACGSASAMQPGLPRMVAVPEGSGEAGPRIVGGAKFLSP